MWSRIPILVTFAVALSGCKDQPLKPMPDAPDMNMIDASTIDTPPGLCAGGTVAYLAICTDTSQCGTCTCETFGHDKRCTKTCTGPSDCPAPSAGCSTAGFCRP
jgi:hypothetical protein